MEIAHPRPPRGDRYEVPGGAGCRRPRAVPVAMLSSAHSVQVGIAIQPVENEMGPRSDAAQPANGGDDIARPGGRLAAAGTAATSLAQVAAMAGGAITTLSYARLLSTAEVG